MVEVPMPGEDPFGAIFLQESEKIMEWPALPRYGDVLEVVGGKGNGGIRVREGMSISSGEDSQRLATGARVRTLEYDAGRVHYELIEGEGPPSGWVSLRANGRDLLINVSDEASTECTDNQATNEALRHYGLRLMEARGACEHFFGDAERTGSKSSFPLLCSTKATTMDLRIPVKKVCPPAEHGTSDKEAAEEFALPQEAICGDVDAKLIPCRQCRLPMGQIAYSTGHKTKSMMHGECMAQHMLQRLRDDEESRKQKEYLIKKSRRAEYDIGWRAEVIPNLAVSAAKLGCSIPSQGLCCIAMDDEDRVFVSSTLEPGAAVNLEYLSVALQVRRREGREPLFSLDPVDPFRSVEDPEGSMQIKRFEPEWLAGTSVGEVLFQADYHLKELSMGEYAQPVLGMKSCFDISKDADCEHEWTAREWFIMRQAEVHVSEDNVIIPFLKMGVEAREQFIGEEGLEDSPLTRPDHPLVKYAEDFTQNFDLIAERKSVVFQLREVAKAAVVAKFLMESGAHFDTSWFDLAGNLESACCLEVPQLWNDRCYSQVAVRDGTILEATAPKAAIRQHCVYGGVDFGIDRFRLSVPSRIATSVVRGRISIGAPSATLMASSRQRLTLGPYQATALLGPVDTGAAPAAAPSRVATSIGVPQRLAAPISSMSISAGLRAPSGALSMTAGLRAPQGVDLSLDKFNLTTPTMASGEVQSQDAELVIGEAFWPGICPGTQSAIANEDKVMLRNIFNPSMSDRREDGESFVPPPTGFTYLQGLKDLLHTEEIVRQMRQEHFLSKTFAEDDAGPLFPSSWTSSFQGTATRECPQGEMLHARNDFQSDANILAALHDSLSSGPPAFDRYAEDGARFRIYRFGSLEVRTTQEQDEQEIIGAVYSIRSAMQAWGGKWNRSARENEMLSKVTEYIERALDGSGGHHLFVVMETEDGHEIVTEKLSDGIATWQENPKDLDDRRSLAKVIRTADCKNAGSTVLGIKAFQMKETRLYGKGAVTPAKCDQYAQVIFSRATGKVNGFTSGFIRPKDIQRTSRPKGKGKGTKGNAKGGSKKPVDAALHNYAVIL